MGVDETIRAHSTELGTDARSIVALSQEDCAVRGNSKTECEIKSSSRVDQMEAGADTGALAEGGEVDIYTWRNSGYLSQYFAVGLIYGGLPATLYGFFLGYLGVPSFVYSTAMIIVVFPWSFKFLYGMVNDTVPICGWRRKPYMVIGWTICTTALIISYFHPMPAPYNCYDGEGRPVLDAAGIPTICNPAAADSSGVYSMLMLLAAFGYVTSNVAADGLTTEFARREQIAHRGRTQTTAYLVRTGGVCVSVLFVAFCMNGWMYNGSFDWTLQWNEVMGIFAIPSAIMIPTSAFLIQEDKVKATPKASTYFVGAYSLLQGKAMTYVIMFQFFYNMVQGMTTTASGNVQDVWAEVRNLQNNLFTLAGNLLFMLGLWLVKKRLLHVSWRLMLATTTIMTTLVDAFFSFLTIFDVVRNQYFYLGEGILTQLPTAIGFVVGTFVIVEMADNGNEGLVYGLITTVSNLGSPFSRAIGNQVYALFKPDISNRACYYEDSYDFRVVVALSFLVYYIFAFVALGFLPLLPNQKEEAQFRKAHWSRGHGYAIFNIVFILSAFLYSVCVNFLGLFPETRCLQFAGGQGCGLPPVNASVCDWS